MALRGGKQAKIDDFLGLQTFASAQNLAFGWWTDSNNFIVSSDGSAVQLRSPANFNTALSTGSNIISAFDYNKQSGNLILFDINIGAVGVSSVRTYSTTGTSNTTVRSNQADARWKRLTINDMAYGLNGTEFVQTNGTNSYAVGITAPSVTPTTSFVAGGSGALAVGVTVSYAYRNSTTGHVSKQSTASSASGPSTLSTLRTAVTASTETGVDGIVLFISVDGGSVRYLYIDTNGDPVVNTNSTGNIDISIALLTNLDTLTPETTYNVTPPQTAFFLFRWRNRLCLLDFRGAVTRQLIQYNSVENCFYGQPWESWPTANIIAIPSKTDAARTGIETSLGALILGEMDAYLIRGALSDKVDGPENVIAITESIQSMNWSIGSRSSYTLVTTPFGELWLDQNKRIQIWTHSGFPQEAGLPIRESLDAILDTDAARNACEATWYQHGHDGGQFVLTACTTLNAAGAVANNKLFIITINRDPEDNHLRFACAVSDISAACLLTAKVSGRMRFFMGVTDRLREELDLDLAGAGWSATQTRSFTMILGNDDTFAYWHSIQFDSSSIVGLTITIANYDGSESQVVTPEHDLYAGTAWYGIIDAYGFRKTITFTYDATDTVKRVIQNLAVRYAPTGRMI